MKKITYPLGQVIVFLYGAKYRALSELTPVNLSFYRPVHELIGFSSFTHIFYHTFLNNARLFCFFCTTKRGCNALVDQ